MKIKHRIIVLLLAGVLVVAGVAWLVRAVSHSEVGLAVDQRINITPEQMTSIKAIGEWEFLSVSNEELVDTIREGMLSDDHLVRIYYGTARLGINMHHVEPGWLTTRGDTLVATLPAIELLDRDFIDEARTKSFFESGSWSHADREALYRKAYRQMLRHTMTHDNLQAARDNGEEQFRRMLKVMGFPLVSVHFRENRR
ncbi:MAG: DUF4230 domain-containing protein [Prevotella sp.]|nr:DUF4230 domain-containing protein [Prevotella sp.]